MKSFLLQVFVRELNLMCTILDSQLCIMFHTRYNSFNLTSIRLAHCYFYIYVCILQVTNFASKCIKFNSSLFFCLSFSFMLKMKQQTINCEAKWRLGKKSESQMGLRDLVRCSKHWATGDSMASKGQFVGFVGLDWNRIAQLHSQVMTSTCENSQTASSCHIKHTHFGGSAITLFTFNILTLEVGWLHSDMQ